VDTNVLIYATFVDLPEHQRARLADGDGTVALCWPVVYAFLRLHRVTAHPSVGREARPKATARRGRSIEGGRATAPRPRGACIIPPWLRKGNVACARAVAALRSTLGV
jgi:predicted nucleic acid-binding protein